MCVCRIFCSDDIDNIDSRCHIYYIAAAAAIIVVVVFVLGNAELRAFKFMLDTVAPIPDGDQKWKGAKLGQFPIY